MTNVLSLTALGSGGVTVVSSGLLVADNAGAKAISLSTIQQISPIDRGAMWGANSTEYGLAANGWTSLKFGSLQYDTGSWTDSNSIGLFRVPSDKWQYVTVGFSLTHFHSTTFNSGYRIAFLSSGVNSQIPWQTTDAPTNNRGGTTVEAVMEVQSGSIIAAQVYPLTSASTEDGSRRAFWIRGRQARG